MKKPPPNSSHVSNYRTMTTLPPDDAARRRGPVAALVLLGAVVTCLRIGYDSRWRLGSHSTALAAMNSISLDHAPRPRWLRATTSTTADVQSSASVVEDRVEGLAHDAHLVERWLQTNGGDEVCTEACCTQKFPCEASGDPTTSNPFSSVAYGVQILLIVILLAFSALFSGLTLGLLSLDKTGLEIVMSGDNEKLAACARRIAPVRKNGNLLLCTMLLGNVAVNSLLSILLADKAGGIVGFLLSTGLIVVFGEILPQAACTRYALQVGSATVPLVRVILFLFLPVAYPLAWLLDRVLGQELATTYSSAELLKLLQIHVQENAMDPDTAVAMTGALKYKDIAVTDVMTPLSNAFMLNVDEKLNFETVAKIFKTGYSRIPVYEVTKNNVIGLLFVKDLIFVDPEDNTRLSDFIEIFGRGVHAVWSDDKLGDVLRELKKGKSHMALVRDVNNEDDTQDPYYEIKGIITLEDIIEEILGDEIVDETDAFVDGTHSVRVDRGENFKWARLRLLDAKIVDETLSHDETMAVTAHLWRNYPHIVAHLTEHQLHRLIADTPVSLLPTAEQKVGQQQPDELLYERGSPNDTCTLILAGKATVLAGVDRFRTDVSSWALLGAGALTHFDYSPDFTAWISAGPVRCLRITYGRFSAAMDASSVEKYSNHDNPGVGSGDAANANVTGATSSDDDVALKKDAFAESVRVPPASAAATTKSITESKILPVPRDVTKNSTEATTSEWDPKPSRKNKFLSALHMASKAGKSERDGSEQMPSLTRQTEKSQRESTMRMTTRNGRAEGSDASAVSPDTATLPRREFGYIQSSPSVKFDDEANDVK